MDNDEKATTDQFQDVSLLEYRGVHSLNFLRSLSEPLRRRSLLSQQRTSLYHQCESRHKSQFKKVIIDWRNVQSSPALLRICFSHLSSESMVSTAYEW